MQQVVILTVQLGLGSTLVDWYRDATSVPFGHLWIDLSPRTDDRLRHCTNSGNTPSKFYVPDQLKHLKPLEDEHTNFLYSPNIATRFSRMQNSVSKKLFQRIYPIFQQVHRQPVARKGNLSEVKRVHVLNNRDKSYKLSIGRTTWKHQGSLLSSQKGLLLEKTTSPLINNQLS